ncbi:hypothetical protein TNIN_232191 [Trichonephila inaurata madagascariensis]|uniref:Uncharacterized protein n=1 Tax=Trichonephila inaurata madagascariensis TaxID=2747483 RepID=A0A8X6WVL2_9ARAC|nr:hypothetical protein TNIN_232191 [Trichonephila inaurata madagascariensis]
MKDPSSTNDLEDVSSSCIFMSGTKRITHIGRRYIILTADCHTEEAVKHPTSSRTTLRKDGKKCSHFEISTHFSGSESRCREWFVHFKSDDTSSEETPRRGPSLNFDDQALLAAVEEDESSTT